MQVEVGDPSKYAETISKEWHVKVSAPEGTDASQLTKKVKLSVKAIAKEKYDHEYCFRSLEGVKLLRPALVQIDLESGMFEPLQVEA